MFTGIISQIGTIENTEQRGDLTITVACDFSAETIGIGDSIACNGCCLTVTRKGRLASGKMYFTADLSAETIACTAPGQWAKGAAVNLERSLKMGDALDGHMVSGHVDGIARVVRIAEDGDSHRLDIEVATELARFIAEKGSVTLHGVALTVNGVEGRFFGVNIIAHTWAATTLGQVQEGDNVNIEVDMLARYVARLLETQA